MMPLMICYNYPPIGGVGYKGVLSLIKTLKEKGVYPLILTIENPSRFDRKSIDEIHDLKVIRARNPFPLNWMEGGLNKFFDIEGFYQLPDCQRFWKRDAVKKALNEEFDIIYATCPPFTSALIGLEIKRETGKPLVVDFRDMWVEHPYRHFPTPFHKRYNEKREREVIENADAIIFVAEYDLNKYCTKYPKYKNKMHFVPNGVIDYGFDIEEKYKKFTLIHTGHIYHKNRDVRYLKPIFNNNIPFEFLSIGSQLLLNDKRIKNRGEVEHKKVLEVLSKSHLAVLLELAENIVTTKIYEYLWFGLPILAITPSEPIKQLLENYSNDYCITTDKKEITDFIQKQYVLWKKGKYITKINKEFRERYNLKVLSKKTVDIMEGVL